MECEHENSARCILPVLLDDNTGLYWSGSEDYSAVCVCAKESVCVCNRKCNKCLTTLKGVNGAAFPTFLRKCLRCEFVMCEDCWYDLEALQGRTQDQAIAID